MSFLLLMTTTINAQNNTDSISPKRNDSLINVAFGEKNKRDVLSAVTSIDVKELMKKNNATYSLDNLQSFVAGYNGNIWGQSPLILVDGIPRRAGDVRMVEIASITVLKDASAVALYGSTGAKGAVLITTRRGEIKPLTIDVRINNGLNFPKRYPSYLNAADYMTYFNEASRNDGNAEKYTADVINNTKAGTNPYKYPDINFFNSDYLRKSYLRTDVTTEIYGGNEQTKYYTNIGLGYNNDIVKFGEQRKNSNIDLKIRANVDMNLTKWLSASTDAVAIISDNYAGRGNFWGSSASLRPNWLTPLLPISMMDTTNASLMNMVNASNHIIDGKYLLGGTSTDQTNTFADMLAAGYIKTKNRTFMFNVGVKADLSNVLKGLSFRTTYGMDYFDSYSEAYQQSYATYQPRWSKVGGNDIIDSLIKFNVDKSSTSEFVGSTSYTQLLSLRAQLDYVRTFNNVHNVSATLLGWGYKSQFSGDANQNGSAYQPAKNANLGLQTSYNFNHKYYIDFTGALTHSVKLPTNNRNAISPTVSLGWRISEEDFFKNNISFINDLKLTATYGSIKQDMDINGYYLYQVNFDNKGGWYQWRDGVAGGWTTGSKRGDNPNLTFVQRNELRFGLNASLLNNLITLDANYFSQNTKGLLTQGTSIFPSYFNNWDYSFLPYINYNEDQRKGVDFSLNINKKMGDFVTSFGFSGMYFSSKAIKRDEVYNDSYQLRAGKTLDANWGYISEGIFMNQDEISQHARQTFGPVMPGDIKYKDVNNDGVIDNRDQVNLGHNGWAAAPFMYGINMTIKWKNLTLFALGSGNTGAIGFKNSSYYWINGTSKFSDVVIDHTTLEKNSNGAWQVAHLGAYPRLTTTSNSNNLQNSTYWMYKTNQFRLARVQLTYDFQNNIVKGKVVHGLSVYINGDNLLLLSKERAMMETNIGSAPQYRFYNLGCKVTF